MIRRILRTVSMTLSTLTMFLSTLGTCRASFDRRRHLSMQAGLCCTSYPVVTLALSRRVMARLVKNGVDQKAGRFYYEGPGHLRRLTSAELIAICNENQLRLKQQLFANQFWGGIEFLTEPRPEVLVTWLDPRRGTGIGSGLILGILATGLIAIALGRLPARIVSAVRRRRRSPSFYVLLPLALALWPLSAPIDHAIRWSRQWEWHRRADDADGSEMYLIFERL